MSLVEPTLRRCGFDFMANSDGVVLLCIFV